VVRRDHGGGWRNSGAVLNRAFGPFFAMQLTSLSLALTRAGLLSSWSPTSLFANSEPGAWFDPSDLTTLFTDAAGTTPVTAVEQPVGLMLDKSRGLVLGADTITNGTFPGDSTTGWTLNTWTVSGEALVKAAGDTGRASGTVATATAGRWYKVEFDATVTASSCQVLLRTGIGGAISTNNFIFSSNGRFVVYLLASDAHTVVQFLPQSASFAGTIDNISVRELPGNHAFQSVATTSRPVLSARYNALIDTENFAAAGWAKTLAAASTATKIIPNNTSALTSAQVEQTVTKAATAQTWVLRVYGQAAEFNRMLILVAGSNISTDRASVSLDLLTGAQIGSITNVGAFTLSSVTSAANGAGFDFTLTFTTDATVELKARYYAADSVATTGNGSSGIIATRSDLRPANQASLPYQRVNTSTDYDADPTKFPRYLRFDGSDDWLQTNTITPGTDKVQVFAGVRKLSDAAAGMVAEMSATFASNNGTFALNAPQTGLLDFAFTSKGTTARTVSQGFQAPQTAVLSMLADISAPSVSLQTNGNATLTNTATQGTGNYLAYPLYIGRRAGTSLPFNGQIYSMIVRFGPNLDAATVTNAQAYVNSKTQAVDFSQVEQIGTFSWNSATTTPQAA
jgi:hypothetical protein